MIPEFEFQVGEIKRLDSLEIDEKIGEYLWSKPKKEDCDCIKKITDEITEKNIKVRMRKKGNKLYIDECNHLILIRVNKKNDGTVDGIKPLNGSWVRADE